LYDPISWNKSYQEIKHNYGESIQEHGNLKNVIVSLAALYLLIIYNEFYKSGRFAVTGINTYEFMQDMGSEIFSVSVYSNLFYQIINGSDNSIEAKKSKDQSVLNKIYNQSRYTKLLQEIEYLKAKFPDLNIVQFLHQKTTDTTLRDLDLMQHKSRLLSLSSEAIGGTVILLNENQEHPYDYYEYIFYEYERSKFKNHREKVLSEISIGSKVRIDEFAEQNEGDVINITDNIIVLKSDKYKSYSMPISNIIDIHEC
jgi:hypothetical protein